MFTGLVQDRATIHDIEGNSQSSIITIKTKLASEMKIGDSISINGVCLTATKILEELVTVDVMIQTLQLSNLGKLKSGSMVNAELATRADARLGGHIVQGHVDGTGKVIANEPGDAWQKFVVEIPQALAKYVVNQGSICVDGVSLTVGEINAENKVTLWLIPETLAQTTLGAKKLGEIVNIEVDVLAKYVERLMNARGNS
jgi:riboflavin synthase